MNRFLFQAAVAALFFAAIMTLQGCGGGGGDSSPAPAAPTQAAPGGTTSSGTTSTGSTGSTSTNVSVGGTTGNSSTGANDAGGLPIPNCTPKQVIVSLLGDSNMSQMFLQGELQKDLDAHFGPNAAIVHNYAMAGDQSNSALYITGDVILENYGAADMMAGIDPAVYKHNIMSMRATLVVTQMPVNSELYDPTPYLAAAKSIGLPVADAYTYMLGMVGASTVIDAVTGLPRPTTLVDLEPDTIHPTNSVDNEITDNVIAPEVFKQVAPLRCLLS